ncbi:RIPOR family member 3 isoform X3 [Hypomesus transpacificus]|uniref:RIPOR family member 3 isoform X3 n=1 Tax=Hypomesus transpacificus TaxID=137520 RepID=UPI001F07C71D|nr:RIPOR family member 3 isoform X3 [Hypomesus transpacificus]
MLKPEKGRWRQLKMMNKSCAGDDFASRAVGHRIRRTFLIRTSSVRSSLRSKASTGRRPRMHLSLGHGGVYGQQPEQVERIFKALRKGLKEYLEEHQAEMDFLSAQQRDTRRNSRLAFLYDLEKEIRAQERFIRRLEFHISKVEELYETYCLQRRLCEGAVNMKRAFSLSPSSRASRDSLLELSRNHRHSLQDMAVMEGELEILLGELHIKMKGLIGFARLCPGDQYELALSEQVVVRLGRQRWRIRGKIQADDRQSWEEEEMVFLPCIHQNFEIKVTEVKGLGSLLVGMVTCASADFFLVSPQLMVVDVTELGTVKLQLEVLWNPFDSREVKPVSTSPSRQSLPSRKSSMYSWSAPNTPSFTEKYFMSMVRQMQDPESSFPIVPKGRSRGVSLLSYLADTTATPTLTSTPAPSPLPHRCPPTPSYGPSLGGSRTNISLGEEEEAGEETGKEDWTTSDPDTGLSTPGQSSRDPLVAMQRYSTPDLLRQDGGSSPDPNTIPSLSPDPSPGYNVDPGMDSKIRLEGSVQQLALPPTPALAPASTPCQPAVRSRAQRRGLALRLGGLVGGLEVVLQERSSSEKELRLLEAQLLHLSTILKNDLSLLKTSSEETLAVEEVMESFDFLSTDFNADDETSCLGSIRLKDIGINSFQKTTLRSLGLQSHESQSAEELGVVPLTSGNWSLDQTLETHLDICTVLLEALQGSGCALVQREVLEEASHQASVLENISRLLLEETNPISASNVLPLAQRGRELQMFWEECTYGGSPFCCAADSFLQTLRKRYTHRVKAKQPGQPHAVLTQLLQQVQTSSRMVPSLRPSSSPDRVTVFQLSTYLRRWGIQDMGEHISLLSKEVYLVSALQSPKRRRVLAKLRGRRLAELLPLGSTLRALASLQTDSNHKVCRAAASCLSRTAGCKAFRTKAVVFYTDTLCSGEVQLQQAACLALKCLKATESVDQIAELWRSSDEDLRSAARETVLSFGKKGHQAFQRMDQIYCELQEEAYQNQHTEITIL